MYRQGEDKDRTGARKVPEEETMKTHKTLLNDVATLIGLEPKLVTLPGGREEMRLTWEPGHLPAVFGACDKQRAAQRLGRGDLVVIDGQCPVWLLPTVSHAFHPSYTAVVYPQGGPEATLPISGLRLEGEGTGQDISFTVTKTDELTLVEYALIKPQVDAAAVLKSLVGPEVPKGIPVRISGRGPIAIAANLGEAYAHLVPYVAFNQPGTGYVVAISHSATALGTVMQ
jgi:hypothetical protein